MYGYGGFGACCPAPVAAPVAPVAGCGVRNCVGFGIIAIAVLILIALGVIFTL